MLVVIKDFNLSDHGRATFDGRLQDADKIEHLQPEVTFGCIPCSIVDHSKIFVAEYPQDSSLIVGALLWLATRSPRAGTEVSEFARQAQGDEAQKVAESLLRDLEDRALRVERGDGYQLLGFCQEMKELGNKKFADKAYLHAIDLYFSALVVTGEIQISMEYMPKYIELRFDCFSNALQAFISTMAWREANEALQIYLTSARHLDIWTELTPKKVGKWAHRCALIKQANGDLESAYQFAVTASSLDPHSKVHELLDQLRAGRVRTRVEQRLQKLVDLFCEIEEIDKHILRVVQLRSPDSTAVFQAGLARMHDAMSELQRRVLLAHQECESAFSSISLIQEHPLLVPYEVSILQHRTREAVAILQEKRKMAQEGSEECSVVDQQNQGKAEESVKRVLFLNHVMRAAGSDSMETEHSANISQKATALKETLESLQDHFIECMPIPEAIRAELKTKSIMSVAVDDDTFGLHLIQVSIFSLVAFTENI